MKEASGSDAALNVLWKRDLVVYSRSPPCICSCDDIEVVVSADRSGHARAFELTSGRDIWCVNLGSVVISSPIPHDCDGEPVVLIATSHPIRGGYFSNSKICIRLALFYSCFLRESLFYILVKVDQVICYCLKKRILRYGY